jgi:[ribosomal protein S5]-alanine N-acetyltransferase
MISKTWVSSCHRGSMKFQDLVGNRIQLIKIEKKILNDLHEYSTEPSLYEYFEFPPFESIKETEKYLDKLIDRSKSGNANYWSINLTKPEKVIGTIGVLNIDWNRMNGDIGFGLSPNYWGKGYFNEAATLLLDYLFSQLNFHRISAMTRSDHDKSIMALEKIGLTKEGVLREYYLSHDAKRHNASIYSILKREFIIKIHG